MDATPASPPAPARTAIAPLAAIARAAQATGERFDFLLAKARLESGLDPSARARTSSASGLFQFVERTWLATIKRHGARHGLGWAADAIDWAGGRLSVASAELRAAILRLRDDPQAAAAMAAEHAAENRARLEARLGRAVGDTELYLAHFLGAGGATRFLRAMATDPDAPAAPLLPRAARANRAIFFDRAGQPRSLASIFERFAARLERAGAGAPPGPAASPPVPPAAATLLALRGPSLASPGPATAEARPTIDPARAAQAAYLLLARLA